VAVFAEQIAGLREGGAEVAWIEGPCRRKEEMRGRGESGREPRHALHLGRRASTPPGRTMMGLPPSALPAFTATLAPPPLALGANCGVGASDLVMSVLDLACGRERHADHRQGQCRHPANGKGAHIHYSGTPAVMGAYALPRL